MGLCLGRTRIILVQVLVGSSVLVFGKLHSWTTTGSARTGRTLPVTL